MQFQALKLQTWGNLSICCAWFHNKETTLMRVHSTRGYIQNSFATCLKNCTKTSTIASPKTLIKSIERLKNLKNFRKKLVTRIRVYSNPGRCACPNQIDSVNLIIRLQFKNENITDSIFSMQWSIQLVDVYRCDLNGSIGRHKQKAEIVLIHSIVNEQK